MTCAGCVQGAIVTFTKGLSAHLIERGIRVNAIAPGPVWTPLVVASFPSSMVSMHNHLLVKWIYTLHLHLETLLLLLACKGL